MINKLAKRILSSLGFVIMRNHPGFTPEWVPLHNKKINLLETLIRLELSLKGEFKFLQIGANDGIQADPIFLLIRKYNLKGTLIEPIADIFEKLRANYSDISENLQFKNIAITLTGSHGMMPFYTFTNSNNKKPLHSLSGYSSTNREKLESIKAETNIEADIASISVPFESVSYFLNNNDVGDLNLLVTDIEGLDIDIVTEFINFKVLPSIIYMEILGQSTTKCSQLIKLLTESGYSIQGNSSDLIAYRSDSR